jgi:hypothetical protein
MNSTAHLLCPQSLTCGEFDTVSVIVCESEIGWGHHRGCGLASWCSEPPLGRPKDGVSRRIP